MLTARKNNSAFTLIELLLVIGILGTLSTFVVFNFRNSLRRGEDTKRVSELHQYQTLLEIYANNNNNDYLARSAIDINTECGTFGETNCVDDPDPTKSYRYIGTTAQYVLWSTLDVDDGDGNIYVICSNGKTGKVTNVPTNSNCPLP